MRVPDQFATDLDGSVPRVIAHSQGSQEKSISNFKDL
jgi:hypothetical protein